MTKDPHLFASPSSVYSLLPHGHRKKAAFPGITSMFALIWSFYQNKKTSHKPLPTTITTRWLSSLWEQNCVTGPCQAARKVFHPLWWKVMRDKPSANSLNHLINILYWPHGRTRMLGLLEYWKSAASFSSSWWDSERRMISPLPEVGFRNTQRKSKSFSVANDSDLDLMSLRDAHERTRRQLS